MDITIAHIKKELLNFHGKMIVIRINITSDINRVLVIEKSTFIILMKHFFKYSNHIKFDDNKSIDLNIMNKLSTRKLDKYVDDLYDLCCKTQKLKYIN